jgi:hypothetical protein
MLLIVKQRNHLCKRGDRSQLSVSDIQFEVVWIVVFLTSTYVRVGKLSMSNVSGGRPTVWLCTCCGFAADGGYPRCCLPGCMVHRCGVPSPLLTYDSACTYEPSLTYNHGSYGYSSFSGRINRPYRRGSSFNRDSGYCYSAINWSISSSAVAQILQVVPCSNSSRCLLSRALLAP